MLYQVFRSLNLIVGEIIVINHRNALAKLLFPESHHVVIQAVIVDNIGQIIAELHSDSLEPLFVDSPANGTRVSFYMYDSCFWKRSTDQPDIAEVERHLVCDERTVAPDFLYLFQIVVSELQDSPVACTLHSSGQFEAQIFNMAQLTAAEHL